MRRDELEAMTTGELLALIEAARKVIAHRQHPPEGAPSRQELAEEFGIPPGSRAAREGGEDQGEAADRHQDL